jgi:uncharacterized protein YozE (UPF0346 family)
VSFYKNLSKSRKFCSKPYAKILENLEWEVTLFPQGNNEFHAFVDAQFLEDAFQVKLDGEGADDKHFCDFVVVVTLGRKLDDFFFPPGESGIFHFDILGKSGFGVGWV